MRLQAWFRTGGGFTYDENAARDGRNDSSQDAVATFLRRRAGYCVQFASSMAVMARTLGHPGPGGRGLPAWRSDRPRTPARISLRDAHAWPELYFEGVGWVRFEPTPATRSGPHRPGPCPGGTPTRTPRERPAARAPSSQPGEARRSAKPNPVAVDAITRSRLLQWLHWIPWRVLGIVALVLLALATPRLTVTLARLRRWRRASTPAAELRPRGRNCACRCRISGSAGPRRGRHGRCSYGWSANADWTGPGGRRWPGWSPTWSGPATPTRVRRSAR